MENMETELIVWDGTIEEMFIEMQPDEKSREEAIQFLKDNAP